MCQRRQSSEGYAPAIHTAEHQRLLEYRQRTSNWKQWGPYLSERAWGTVREDYSAYGTGWTGPVAKLMQQSGGDE